MDKKAEMKPKFNEEKTTQATTVLLQLSGGSMNYMKLIKLLYNIDREALRRWARPVTFDDFYSMKHGQVVSKTLNKIRSVSFVEQTYWDRFIHTEGLCVSLDPEIVTDCGTLSPVEIELIREMYAKYKDKNQFDMRDEHHNPELFPEWIDPQGSSIKTDYGSVMKFIGFSEDDIVAFHNDMEELVLLEELA